MIRRLVPVALVALSAGSGCSSKGPQTSSETHFNTCTIDAKCVALYGANYSCVQTVCRETFVDGGSGGSGGSSPLVDSGPSTEPGNGGSAGSVDSGGAPDTNACAAGACDANCVANVPTALVNLFGGADAGAAAPRASWTTVRLDFTTYRVLGFQYGAAGADAGATLDQAGALSRAVTDTGFGADTGFPSDAMLLSVANPTDEWIFWKSPSDFGDVAAVSASVGQTTFGASTVWAGKGDIAYPKTWLGPAELGHGCAVVDKPLVRDVELLTGQTEVPGHRPNDPLDVVWRTALPEALTQAGQIATSAVVFSYERTTGAFDPTTMEWIVIVNAAGR